MARVLMINYEFTITKRTSDNVDIEPSLV
jgi:hypothetical protein